MKQVHLKIVGMRGALDVPARAPVSAAAVFCVEQSRMTVEPRPKQMEPKCLLDRCDGESGRIGGIMTVSHCIVTSVSHPLPCQDELTKTQ